MSAYLFATLFDVRKKYEGEFASGNLLSPARPLIDHDHGRMRERDREGREPRPRISNAAERRLINGWHPDAMRKWENGRK